MEERESRNTPGPLPRSSLWGESQQGGFSHGEAWRAKLRGANLSGADLRGADLIEADLIGVDLSGAKLREANLHGTFVLASPHGCYAQEVADLLHAEVQEPLRHLLQQQRLSRTEVDGPFLYTAMDSAVRRQQSLARRSAQAVPVAVHSCALQVSPDELNAGIVLFYGLLDEQQRRLFAGLESLRLGHGGDTLLADFLGLDPHTVARGRQQLLDQKVVIGRTRRPGAGRTPREKNRPA